MKKALSRALALCIFTSLCSCSFTESKEPYALKDLHEDIAPSVAAMYKRAKRGNNSPYMVVSASNGRDQQPLYELSWTPAMASSAGSADELLDVATVKLLSRDGSVPLYGYCFSEDHAQVATHFCTKTLISEMKAQVSRDAKKDPEGSSS